MSLFSPIHHGPPGAHLDPDGEVTTGTEFRQLLKCYYSTTRIRGMLYQLVEQPLRVFQVGGVEALGEPSVDGCEQVAGLALPALLAPQPGEACSGAQFVAARALIAGDRQGGAERGLGLRGIGVR